jgi:hypothetical protein
MDLPLVNGLARTLAAKGYRVSGVTLDTVRTAGELRYSYEEDQRQAMQVGAQVELALAERGIKANLSLNLARPAQGPRGQFDVWLPQFSRGRAGY